MPTRRTILKSAAALSAAPLAPKVVFAGGAKPAPQISVLYDHRHSEARDFRLRASQWNVSIFVTPDGDITDLWQDRLRIAWNDKPAPLAGLTERPALFMLEQLGWAHGMRVLFLTEHELPGKGAWQHSIVRSNMPGLKRQLEAAGRSWPAVLADQMLTAPQEVASKDLRPSGAAMENYLNEPGKLYSWIIAPRSVAEHL